MARPGPTPRALLLAALAALLAVQGATATSDVWVRQGGEPGVFATIDGLRLADAANVAAAIPVDPDVPVRLQLSIAPPENVTWELRSVRVGLLVNGAGSEPPAAASRTTSVNTSLPPGFTVVINRTIELASLKRVGAGTFLMEAVVFDADANELYAQEFYVRVKTTPEALLSVQGATLTVLTAATGYGLWQVAKDVKELRDAWDRHRRKRELARLDVIGRAEAAVEHVVEKGGKSLAGAVGLHRDVQDSERALGPVRWAATGLGLGGVGLAWLQFTGRLAFDAMDLLIVALEAGAIFLTLALVVNALVRRARRKAAERAAAAQAKQLQRVEVQEGSAPAPLVPSKGE